MINEYLKWPYFNSAYLPRKFNEYKLQNIWIISLCTNEYVNNLQNCFKPKVNVLQSAPNTTNIDEESLYLYFKNKPNK